MLFVMEYFRISSNFCFVIKNYYQKFESSAFFLLWPNQTDNKLVTIEWDREHDISCFPAFFLLQRKDVKNVHSKIGKSFLLFRIGIAPSIEIECFHVSGGFSLSGIQPKCVWRMRTTKVIHLNMTRIPRTLLVFLIFSWNWMHIKKIIIAFFWCVCPHFFAWKTKWKEWLIGDYNNSDDTIGSVSLILVNNNMIWAMWLWFRWYS